MQIWTVHSTKQVFGNARPERDSSGEIDIHTARNAYAAMQVVVRDIAPIHITGIKLTATGGKKSIRGIKNRIFRTDFTTYNDRTSYPDRLIQLKFGKIDLKLKAHSAQSFLIDFFVPEKAAAGVKEYTLVLMLEGGQEAKAVIRLYVHKVSVMPANRSLFGHEYFFNLQLLPNKAAGKLFTEEWWKSLGHYADVMRELRNNTICVPALHLLTAAGSRKLEDGSYRFVWDYFDRYVKLFIDRGAARDFTLSALMQSVYGEYLSAIGEDGKGERLDTFSAEAEKFIRALYTAIEAHLKEMGWDNIFRSHIEDEPHTTEGWLWADKIIAEAAPSITTGEPLDMIESARVICEKARWAVPRINVHDEDPEVFKKMVARGGELWLYSCCFPEEAWWLNKFVDLPFIRSRLMEWACAGVGAKGFLHWGFNYWGNGDSLYGFNADARFKGDGAIVYPNLRRKKLDLSMRFINTRDGLQDADLFMRLLGSDNAELREKALALLRDTTGEDFTTFSDDSKAFEKQLEKLLELGDKL